MEELRLRARELATGKQPRQLTFPDGSQVEVASWRALAQEVVQWLGSRNKLPQTPFRGRKGGKCYFLNTAPNHQHEPMRAVAEFRFGDRVIYMDTKRSARDLIACVGEVCQAGGVPPSGFLVNVEERAGK